MTQSDILRIISKAFGLYFIVLASINLRDFIMYGIASLDPVINQADQYLTYRYLLIGYGFNIVYNCVASFVLISRAGSIANTISSGRGQKLELGLTKSDSVELIIIAISALVILQAIPTLVANLTSYAYFNPNEEGFENEFWSQGNNREVAFSLPLNLSLVLWQSPMRAQSPGNSQESGTRMSKWSRGTNKNCVKMSVAYATRIL